MVIMEVSVYWFKDFLDKINLDHSTLFAKLNMPHMSEIIDLKSI